MRVSEFYAHIGTMIALYMGILLSLLRLDLLFKGLCEIYVDLLWAVFLLKPH